MGTYTKPLYGKTIMPGIHQVVSGIYDDGACQCSGNCDCINNKGEQVGVQIKYYNGLSKHPDGNPKLYDTLQQCIQAYNNLKNKL